MIEVREVMLVDAETLQREKEKTLALMGKGLLRETAAQARCDLLRSLGLLNEAENEIVLTAGKQSQDNLEDIFMTRPL